MVTFKERINNLRNVKRDWTIVKNNPYAHQRFMYTAYKGIIIFVGVLIIFQIGLMIYNASSGHNTPMNLLTRAFMVLVGVIIVMKLYGYLAMLKTTLLQYETSPSTNITNTLNEKNINIVDEIDNIFKQYDDKGGKN
jgi:hypothetical protein